MNQASDFQLHYPLSSKKFWKKIIPSLFSWLVLIVIILGVPAIIFYLGRVSEGLPGIWNWFGYFIGTALILYIIAVLLRAWYIKTYIRRYYYDCNDNFVTIQKGVFSPTEIHVQYQKIQDVYVDQDILDRIMGLYDVHIASATASSGIAAHIDGVEQNVAEALKELLLSKIRQGSGSSFGGNNPVSQPSSETPTFQFSQKISTETYPISSSWILSKFIGAIFHAIWMIFVLTLFFYNGLSTIFSVMSILEIAALLFVIGLMWRIIWTLLWKQAYYFEFLPDYILLRTGVISKSENHLPYKSIQNVTMIQGVIERLFGLATVIIQNASQGAIIQTGRSVSVISSAIPIIGQPREKANELNQILNQIVASINNPNSGGL